MAVVLLTVSYALFFSAYTLAQHRAFLTLGFDLGNVDQAIWSTLQGRILQYTNWPGGTIRFGNHFEPILLLVSLSYLLHSGPETLLVLQSVVLALGAWPVYRLAGRRFESDWMGALFALVYLLFPGLQAANVFDFHAVALAPTFLAWAFWSLEERRYRRFVVWSLLAMSCKEEMPLLVAMMGLWLLTQGCSTPLGRRLGMATIVGGVTWTAMALLVIIPGLNTLGVSPQMWRYAHLGQGPQEMLVNLATRPGLYVSALTEPLKIKYLVKLLFPTGYLALLAPQVLLLAAPSLAVNLLSSRPHMIALEEFHYTAPITPFVVIAGAYGLAAVIRKMRQVFRRVDRRFLLAVGGGYVLLLTLAYHRVNGMTPLAYDFAWPQFGEHERTGHQLIEQIPTDAAVSAQNHLNPHLTQRARVYVFPRLKDAEYALVDVTAYPYVDPIESFYTTVRDLLTDPNMGVVAAADGYILFQRQAGSAELPSTFFASSQPFDEPKRQTSLALFDQGPTLIDVSWRSGKGDTLFVETTWLRQNEHITEGQMLIELVRSPEDWAVAREQELVLSAGYPPQKWQLEQPVRDVVYLTLPANTSIETWHIGLVYRSSSGLRLPVTLAEGGNWRVDESGSMLLVPLDTLFD